MLCRPLLSCLANNKFRYWEKQPLSSIAGTDSKEHSKQRSLTNMWHKSAALVSGATGPCCIQATRPAVCSVPRVRAPPHFWTRRANEHHRNYWGKLKEEQDHYVVSPYLPTASSYHKREKLALLYSGEMWQMPPEPNDQNQNHVPHNVMGWYRHGIMCVVFLLEIQNVDLIMRKQQTQLFLQNS